jgi:hypothetical protein
MTARVGTSVTLIAGPHGIGGRGEWRRHQVKRTDIYHSPAGWELRKGRKHGWEKELGKRSSGHIPIKMNRALRHAYQFDLGQS